MTNIPGRFFFFLLKLFYTVGGCIVILFSFLFLKYFWYWPLPAALAGAAAVAGLVFWIPYPLTRAENSPRENLSSLAAYRQGIVACILLVYLSMAGFTVYKILFKPWALTGAVHDSIIVGNRIMKIHYGTRTTPDFPSKNEILDNYIGIVFRDFIYRQINPGMLEETVFNYQLTTPSFRPLRNVFVEEYIEHNYLFKSGRKDPLILDCGSNIGLSIIYFKQLYPAARIYGFEADPSTFSILEKNITRNDLPQVTLVEGALTDKTGPVTFYSRGPAGTGNSLVPIEGEEVTVEGILLSDYITEKVDFLKIDIEGAETAVMDDLVRTGTIKHVQESIIEFHHTYPGSDAALVRLLGQLVESGFRYQIITSHQSPFKPGAHQNLIIYARRKS